MSISKKMELSINSNLTDSQLKQTCRALGISVGRKSSRHFLIAQLQKTTIPNRRKRNREENAMLPYVIRIQRWWKKIKSKRFILFSNDDDFVTLEPITVYPFYLVEESRHVYQFHPLNLAQYFLKEGNFTNPYTRKPLNIVELRRLDKMVKTHDPTFVSLCTEQKRITIQRAQEREHMRVCQLLHQECLQFINRVVQVVQHPNIRRLDKILFHVEHTILPQFFDTFRQLFILDQGFACESICHVLQTMHVVWNNASIVNTREGCFLIESIITTMSQFVTSILPVLPSMMPELTQLQQLPVR